MRQVHRDLRASPRPDFRAGLWVVGLPRLKHQIKSISRTARRQLSACHEQTRKLERFTQACAPLEVRPLNQRAPREKAVSSKLVWICCAARKGKIEGNSPIS